MTSTCKFGPEKKNNQLNVISNISYKIWILRLDSSFSTAKWNTCGEITIFRWLDRFETVKIDVKALLRTTDVPVKVRTGSKISVEPSGRLVKLNPDRNKANKRIGRIIQTCRVFEADLRGSSHWDIRELVWLTRTLCTGDRRWDAQMWVEFVINVGKHVLRQCVQFVERWL